MKLPGSLIYMDEDLDEAAKRVLNELTGLKNVNLMQFKAFGSKNRTKDPRDVHWLERAMQSRVERIVTIAYLSLVKIDRALNRDLDNYQASWVAMPDIKALAFDHNLIIKEAMHLIRDTNRLDVFCVYSGFCQYSLCGQFQIFPPISGVLLCPAGLHCDNFRFSLGEEDRRYTLAAFHIYQTRFYRRTADVIT
jgi:ADP-ribose pyrophosphatase YjhB (NUDIX family)